MPTNPMEYIWPGIIAAQAMYVAAKLRIPDLLASGPKTAAELASECGAHAPALERLLRALATLEMFRPRLTAVSSTRRLPRRCAQMSPIRSEALLCFYPHLFFGAHSESSTNRCLLATLLSNVFSASNFSSIWRPIRLKLQSSMLP